MNEKPPIDAIRRSARLLAPASALKYVTMCFDRGYLTREEMLSILNEPRAELLVNSRGGNA